MLELFFAAALMDTVIAPVDYGTIYVHEWGAVTFAEETVIFGANPLTDPNSDFISPDQWDEPVARAPIVYFYGAEFSGTFTVSVHSGNFIETLPSPERLLSTSSMPPEQSFNAVWGILGTSVWSNQELPDEYPCISSDLLESWRTPPSYLLEFSDGTLEKFIYYECTLLTTPESDYYPVEIDDGEAVLAADYREPLMQFTKDGETVNLEIISDGAESGGDIPELLCDWAGGSMKSQELISMWDTWETWIYDGSWSGDTLLVFPLPQQTIEGMTSINLETASYYDVEYSRFYLGILSI